MEFQSRLRRHFTLVLFAALAVGLLMKLGFWQLSRAQEKQTRASMYTSRIIAQPVSVDDLIESSLPDVVWRRVSAFGRFQQAYVLLDNRTIQGRVGYEVLSPMELVSGKQLLVNRGWVAAGPTRASLPDLATEKGPLKITGHLGPPPVTGIKFGGDADLVESLGANIIRTQHVDFAELSKRYNAELGPFVLYLDKDSPAGFHRSWTPPGDGSAKHKAYAVQWFAMAAILAMISVLLFYRANKGQHT